MRRSIPERDIAFRHEDGCLVRTVTGADGRGYTQRCLPESFQRLAHVIDQSPAMGISIDRLARAEGLPHTQVAVALAFLDQGGIIERRGKLGYAASRCLFEEAMVEWHALREEPIKH